MAELIQPRTLQGFRDYLPELMIPREELMDQARKVYRSYGFAPIDTPALEYTEILLGKGGMESDKQLYRFTDNGDRDVALRFDLTIPFARFAAQHINELGIPFKRYHIAPVWRGERPQRGRYREFVQCDFDTIGTTSNASDIEVVLVIHDLMLALKVEQFEIRVNNRLILNGLLESLGLSEKTDAILRALDKSPKIGIEGVERELADAGLDTNQRQKIAKVVEKWGPYQTLLDEVALACAGNAKVEEGTNRLRELFDVAIAAGVPEERLRLDLSIARGLDYYTGTVYETFLTDNPDIGSVCSGGRYDNLAGLYTKQKLPGVGASLGLDRLLAAMEQLDKLKKGSTPAQVLVVQFVADRLGDYQKMARSLRAEEIKVEVYPEVKKIGQQLQYADRRGFRVALIAGPDEFAQGAWNVKDLRSQTQREKVPTAEVAGIIRGILAE